MEIEYRNENYKNENIYKVGNVIENDGVVYLVCRGHAKYFLMNLYTATLSSGMYGSLEELVQAAGDKDDTLVKAKVVVDYKIDGGTEDEN
jgi:hypothetical protein